jgi:uncharacterized membrane protein
MNITCPLCGVRGTLADTFLGRKVRCPKCGGLFVAQPEGADASPGLSEEAEPTTGAAPFSAGVDNGSAAITATDPSRPAGLETDGETFRIGRLLGEAWRRSSGVKGVVWAGTAVMYLALLALMLAGALLFSLDLPLSVTGAFVLNTFWQTVVQVVLLVFLAGLLRIGIDKVEGAAVSWRHIFSGFSLFWPIAVATVLQMVLISIGFLLLILPGIYLSIGYAMTLPLIIDQGLSPWQAMEASRRAIHPVWWRMAALFLASTLLLFLSLIPLGLGLIWTWPMVILLAGVVYHQLFKAGGKAG